MSTSHDLAASGFQADFDLSLRSALFLSHSSRLPQALDLLSPGSLHRALAPGVPAAVLAEWDMRSLHAACAAVAGPRFASLAGLPFEIEGEPNSRDVSLALARSAAFEALASASPLPDADQNDLCGDLIAVPIDAVPPGFPVGTRFVASDSWRLELTFEPASPWLARAGAAMDSAAVCAYAGVLPDSVIPFPTPDGKPGYAEIAGMIDSASRLRFADGISWASERDDPMSSFRNSYYRRSAACGIARHVACALALPGGTQGRDADGWPVWWKGRAATREALLCRIPPGVIECAIAATLGMPA